MGVEWGIKVGYVSSCSAGMLTTRLRCKRADPPDFPRSDMLASMKSDLFTACFKFSMIQLLVGADKAAN